MSEKNRLRKFTKHTAFIPEVTYKPVEGEVRGLADVRNITVVQNDSDTYKVKVFNVESATELFPIVPDSVTCDTGEQKPTGDMWTPWCDNQQALEEGLQRFVIEKIVKRRDVLGHLIEESNLPNVACKLGGLKIVRC